MAHACYCWCGIVVRYPGGASWCGTLVWYRCALPWCGTLVVVVQKAKTFVYFLLLLTWFTKRTYLLKLKPIQARTGTTCMLGQGRVSAWTGAKLKIAFTPRPVAGS